MTPAVSPTTISTSDDNSGSLTPTFLAGILVLCALLTVFMLITLSVCFVVAYKKKSHPVQTTEESPPYPKKNESLILGKGEEHQVTA